MRFRRRSPDFASLYLLPLSSRYPALIDITLLSMGKGFKGQSSRLPCLRPSTCRSFSDDVFFSLRSLSPGSVASTST